MRPTLLVLPSFCNVRPLRELSPKNSTSANLDIEIYDVLAQQLSHLGAARGALVKVYDNRDHLGNDKGESLDDIHKVLDVYNSCLRPLFILRAVIYDDVPRLERVSTFKKMSLAEGLSRVDLFECPDLQALEK